MQIICYRIPCRNLNLFHTMIYNDTVRLFEPTLLYFSFTVVTVEIEAQRNVWKIQPDARKEISPR